MANHCRKCGTTIMGGSLCEDCYMKTNTHKIDMTLSFDEYGEVTSVPCPACEEPDAEEVTDSDYEQAFRCKVCGFEFALKPKNITYLVVNRQGGKE